MTDIYYWDTCVFIAWLKAESPPNRTADEAEGIREIVSKVETGRAKLITSTITTVELLECDLPVGAKELFEKLMQRRMMSAISADIRVTALASQIRNHYKTSPEFKNKTVCTPDAIHLASAILYKADEFHTFDRSNKKSLGLLPLNNNVAGHELTIKKPSSRQMGITLK